MYPVPVSCYPVSVYTGVQRTSDVDTFIVALYIVFVNLVT